MMTSLAPARPVSSIDQANRRARRSYVSYVISIEAVASRVPDFALDVGKLQSTEAISR